MSSETIHCKKPAWATGQTVRETGLVEDMCQHGVGHPNAVWCKGRAEHWGVHGCDGCCVSGVPYVPVEVR